MRKFKNKKGFTIVELVVVIAVIGVLTAILVPTFVTLSKRAQVANMQSFVTNINKKLAMNASTDGKNATMHDAQKDARDIGFDIEKITPFDGHDIVWDSDSDRFMLVKGDEIVLKDNSTELNSLTATTKKKLFKVAKSVSELSDDYSHYLAKNESWESSLNGASPVKFEAGVDVGDNEGISQINYERPSTAEGQEVIIRTNGGSLEINAEQDTFRHYGSAKSATLTAVGNNSYYENGPVDQVNIKKGRLVLTNSKETSVKTVYLQATGEAYDDIILATQSGADLPDLIARDSVPLPSGNSSKTVVTVQTNVNEDGKQPEKTETINLYATKGNNKGNDVYEATNGYNVSALALLVVEASSDSAKQQAADQISNPVVAAKVSESKTPFEVTNQGDMDEVVSKKIAYAKIMSDFTADHVFLLNHDVTIDGENKTITSSANRVFRIAGNNRYITMRNLGILSTYSGDDSRCISIDSSYDAINLTLEKCDLKCGYYALNITGSNGSGSKNIRIDVYDSTIEGYAAINNHASSSLITVNSSTLIGNNKFPANEWNNFATIVFDGGNFEFESSYTYGNKIVVNNSTLKQITLTTNYETVFSSQYGNISSEAHFNNCKVEHEGENAKYFNYGYKKTNNVKIFIDGNLYYEGK